MIKNNVASVGAAFETYLASSKLEDAYKTILDHL